MLIVFTTTQNESDAERLADAAVRQKLAGCVQIIPAIRSVYEWEGKIHSDRESLLLFKTSPEKYPALEALLKKEHSYDVPEITAIETKAVSAEYEAWLLSVID